MRLDMIYKACILPLAQVFGLVGVDERNIHFDKFEIDDHFQSSLCVGIVALRCKFYVVTRVLISTTILMK